MVGLADTEIDETGQIDKSLFYIEKKFNEIENFKSEIELLERDLAALKDKLIKRKKELSGSGTKKRLYKK